ncbi:hypothetical protein DEIPH_ctg011orf0056 [Deinococcus phoenicis]|uniref:Uncharacterized protein n=1 Tax=Deinococcus phoenicis TaxID=1476583 RepID=A0A016QSS5_9DEIO|nr:hypothetical protein [Deinococcus phoenicis]EYB69088.1 hypothetical protein DEIPH_ctg011orf0056 [Deinococcus phoenicis]
MIRLFDAPERASKVPLSLYKKLSPDNPRARVSLMNTLTLMYSGKLAATIREHKLAKLTEKTSWIKALELLESKGLYQGMHYREIAAALGVTPDTAKAACLRAEQEIYDIYGIHVGFFDNDGTWRLGTDKDVARKYGEAMRAVVKWAKRASMYAEQARVYGEQKDPLMLPLFDIPKDLKDGDGDAKA